jgi:nucleotide-binding universal stress UspA family protein
MSIGNGNLFCYNVNEYIGQERLFIIVIIIMKEGTMFERVLTATDMLEACDAVVINALEIAKKTQAKLSVLHVLEPSYFHECGPLENVRHFKTGEETASSEEYRKAVKEELEKRCAGALKQYAHYQIDLAYGKPSIEIRRWARKFGADLIVLGPHAGRVEEEKELIGLPIGNTVADVIVHTITPVMIIGRIIPQEKLNFKKIMVCVDFSRSCKHASDFAVKLAQQYGSELFFLHMENQSGPEGTISRETIKDFCSVPGETNAHYDIWGGTEPYRAILDYARQKDADLIIMGSRSKEREEKPYVGSAVELVSADRTFPVIVITHPDALMKIH